MIAGHLQVKKGNWYAVLSYKDESGKRKKKWFPTKLKEKGNKKKAEEMLFHFREIYTGQLGVCSTSPAAYFHEYIKQWLNERKHEIAQTTYDGYSYAINNSIAPYFEERMIKLCNIKAAHINQYYQYLFSKGLSANSVIRQHANIYKALKDAQKNDLIPSNIIDKIIRPKSNKFAPTVYSVAECNELLGVIKDERIEIVIVLALFLGLRRSEILGLRWKAIDFENNTIIINHSVTRSVAGGHYSVNAQDKLKRQSSFRTLPLPAPVKDYLQKEYATRIESRDINPNDYICLDVKGNIIKPNYVSQTFSKILEKNTLRKIRFHDLRHSFANLLIASRVPLIEVQHWLGHSNISTTADLYSHLEFDSLLFGAEVIKKN